MTVYSVSGVKCLKKWYVPAKVWVYVPVAKWRTLTVVQRRDYADRSPIQLGRKCK